MRRHGLSLTLLFSAILLFSAPWASSQQEQIPAFNEKAPPKGTKLPPILSADQLWAENAQYPYQTHAYELAAKIPVGFAPTALLLLLRSHGAQQFA